MTDMLKSVTAMVNRRRWLAVLATVAGVASVLVLSSPAQAATAVCPAASVCFWDNQNYSGSRFKVIAVASLYSCHSVAIPDNRASSVYNNTKYAFELWDWSGGRLIGTAARYKAYSGFGSSGDDKIDLVLSPGCAPDA